MEKSTKTIKFLSLSLLIASLVSSCGSKKEPNITTSSIINEQPTSQMIDSNNNQTASDDKISSVISTNNNSTIISSDINSQGEDKTSSSTTSESKDDTSSQEDIYNPDGSKRQNPPSNLNNYLEFSQTETVFEFNNSFPQDFSYIYGHKILTSPDYYTTGGWKISYPNSSARMGIQTPFFVTNLKLEIRLYIGSINNSSNKVDQNTPFITVYGFNKNAEIVRTKYVDNLTNFYNYKNSSNPINFYMDGTDIEYLEIRFTSSPYKGSQCYNFEIKKIGFKTFPYPYSGD